jgi:hypothetical protein
MRIEHSVQSGIYKTFNLENEFFSIIQWKDIISKADKLLFELEYPIYMDKSYVSNEVYNNDCDIKNKLYLNPITSDRSHLLFLSHYFYFNNLLNEAVQQYADACTDFIPPWVTYYLNNKD